MDGELTREFLQILLRYADAGESNARANYPNLTGDFSMIATSIRNQLAASGQDQPKAAAGQEVSAGKENTSDSPSVANPIPASAAAPEQVGWLCHHADGGRHFVWFASDPDELPWLRKRYVRFEPVIVRPDIAAAEKNPGAGQGDQVTLPCKQVCEPVVAQPTGADWRSARERVLVAYPNANAAKHSNGGWFIYRNEKKQSWLCCGPTEAEAWLDADRRIA